jgi:HK97 family phage prohead protease
METKSIPSAIKGVDGRTVIGIASVFGNVDDMGDRIWPGAYSKTISERATKFRHLWNHDFFSPPIAKIDTIQEVGRDALPEQVLSAAPDAMGGLEVTRTYLDTPRADEVLKGITSGAINEMSIGLDALKYDFSEVDNQRVREIREIRLYDTSDVLWGMNAATAAAKMNLPLELLLKQLELQLADLKAGARHSNADTKLLNAIHKAAVDLGATSCKGLIDDESDGKSRAVPVGALTLSGMRLRLLELTN